MCVRRVEKLLQRYEARLKNQAANSLLSINKPFLNISARPYAGNGHVFVTNLIN